MPIKKQSARQEPTTAVVAFGIADFATALDGVVNPAIQLPAGAVVLSGVVVIDTVFNSLTSDTLTVGDSLSAARYKGAVDAKALGLTQLIPTGYRTLNQIDIGIGITGVGTKATTGAGRLIVTYLVMNKSDHTEG